MCNVVVLQFANSFECSHKGKKINAKWTDYTKSITFRGKKKKLVETVKRKKGNALRRDAGRQSSVGCKYDCIFFFKLAEEIEKILLQP